MLSWIIALVALVLGAFVLFFLGIGLLIITGGIVVLVVLIVGLSLAYGFIEPYVLTYMPTNEKNISQKFMTCLVVEKSATCRKEYTNWGDDRQATMDAIAHEVQAKLGKRYAQTVRNLNLSTISNNGYGKTQMQLVVDYELHKQVHEDWFIETGKHGTRITGFKWNY